MFPLGGTWQLDDTNHTKYPIITTNLVSGQRDYFFTTDQQSNVILDIYKILIADPSGVFQEIYPVDQQTANSYETNVDSLTDGRNQTGTPIRYDKTGNGIFLDPIPSYNSTGGLKIYINREGSYFTTSDTDKKVGFAHLFHEYFIVSPSYKYAYKKGLKNVNSLEKEMIRLRDAIKAYYGKRQKDVKGRVGVSRQNNH